LSKACWGRTQVFPVIPSRGEPPDGLEARLDHSAEGEPRGERKEEGPVLKHGPRSAGYMRGEGGKTLEPKLTHIGLSTWNPGGNTPLLNRVSARAERRWEHRPPILAL